MSGPRSGHLSLGSTRAVRTGNRYAARPVIDDAVYREEPATRVRDPKLERGLTEIHNRIL